MKKYLQNRIAESGSTLPVAAIYAFVVWLLAGLLSNAWWGQLALFAVTAYLLVEQSNRNALLRVRSRMVSSTFLVLSCIPVAMMGSLSCGVTSFCFIITLNILFGIDHGFSSIRGAYYAFLSLGVASLFFVQVLFFVPLLWLLMATQLQALNWRSWWASVLGIFTPYWLCFPWLLYQNDWQTAMVHFAPLTSIMWPVSYDQLGILQLINVCFVVLLMLIGVVHFRFNRFDEKIRIRQLYGFFTSVAFFIVGYMAVCPELANPLLRILILCASPLIAHLLTLSSSRLSNVFFFVVIVLSFLLTMANLYDMKTGRLAELVIQLWSGSSLF